MFTQYVYILFENIIIKFNKNTINNTHLNIHCSTNDFLIKLLGFLYPNFVYKSDLFSYNFGWLAI